MESVEIPIRKLEILLSITCCKNQSLLREYLDGCLNEEILGQEDIVPIIIAVVKSEIGFELVTEFISEHIKTVYDR